MRRGLAVCALSLLALLVTGVAEARTITLVGQNDLRYSVEHIKVRPGEQVTIKLVNKSHLPASAMAHNWVLLKRQSDADAFDQAAQSAAGNDYFPTAKANETLAHTGMVTGGHSDTVTFTAPTTPGNYTYICTFPGHYRAGMKGTLTVAPNH